MRENISLLSILAPEDCMLKSVWKAGGVSCGRTPLAGDPSSSLLGI